MENGNLTKDNNKGITDIKYNYLNLPEEVIKDANNKAKYIYDAADNKVKAIVTQSGTATPRYYVGIMEYNNSKVLKLIPTDKGIVDMVVLIKYEEYIYNIVINHYLFFLFTKKTGSYT